MADWSWRDERLSSLVKNFDSLRQPVKASARKPGPYPYYGASGVVDHVENYLFDGEYLLVSEDGENLRSRSTPIAFNVAGRFWPNNHVHVLQGLQQFDTRFLKYALDGTDILGYLTGSAQPKLTRGALDSLVLRIPPAGVRRAIAEVLGALDDKIEANRKLAATADDLVRSLLDRLWRTTEDWIALGDLVRNIKDTVQPSGEQEYVGLEHLPRRHMWLDAVPEPTEISSAKSAFSRGDVLFGKLRPNFHKVVSAPTHGICSTEILVLRALEDELGGFALAACSSDLVLQEVTRATEGTRMPRTNWKHLSSVEVPWPGINSARRFSAQVVAVRNSVEAKLREMADLAELRDSLLPKLMSGQLRVREAEAAIAGVR